LFELLALVPAEIGLDSWVERRVGPVVVKKIHLDIGIARAIELKVTSVEAGGPAAIAGLQSERMIARTALTAVLAVGGLVFPPAMFVATLISQSDVGESHDLIIAFEGERTRRDGGRARPRRARFERYSRGSNQILP
jgi:hypothetical protein